MGAYSPILAYPIVKHDKMIKKKKSSRSVQRVTSFEDGDIGGIGGDFWHADCIGSFDEVSWALERLRPKLTRSIEEDRMKSINKMESRVHFRIGARIAVLMGILCLTGVFGFSQERFQANAGLTLGYPQGEFKRNLDNTGIGGSALFLYRLPRSPVSVGVSFGVMVYGSEVREEPFSSTVPDVYVDVKTRNYILLGHFVARFQPFEGYFRPYVDGLFGLNYIWTETGVYDQSGYEDDRIARTVNLSDTTLSYGIGGGVMIQVVDVRSRHPWGVYVDLGIRYLKGGNAEYMREGSIERWDGRLEYEVRESVTDLMTLNIGVTFCF